LVKNYIIMVTIKCIKPIKDSSVNRLRQLNEVFTTTPERAVEMQNGLGVKFKDYFVVQKVSKIESKKEVPTPPRQKPRIIKEGEQPKKRQNNG